MGRTSTGYFIANFYLQSSKSSFFNHAPTAPSGSRRGFIITLRHSTVGRTLLSDQPDAENSTWQHTTLTTNIHASGGIRPYNPNNWAATETRLRPRGHWDRPNSSLDFKIKAKKPLIVTKHVFCFQQENYLHPVFPKILVLVRLLQAFSFFTKNEMKENIEYMCHCFVLFNFRLLRIFSIDVIFVTCEYGALV
jgi:hypothetical protein